LHEFEPEITNSNIFGYFSGHENVLKPAQISRHGGCRIFRRSNLPEAPTPLAVHNPVILLTFANPQLVPQSYLPMLMSESASIYQHLRPFDIDDVCNIDRIENATIEVIFDTVEAWTRRKDIVLFHYGGHAEGGGLLLNTASGSTSMASATGLARLLGKIPSLQLVFLNGCSTHDQVQLLLDNHVKAVIATSSPINDEMAGDFADRFYKNLAEGSSIGEAFGQAKDFVRSKYDYEVQDAAAFRSLDLGAIESSGELPWGLYLNSGAEAVLNWRLPNTREPKPSFSKVDKYTCNRAEQNSRFKTNFIQVRGRQKFQFYFIHGEEKQSPVGLFNRFVLEHIATAYDRYFHKVALVEEASAFEEAKINAITSLFKALELNPNRYSPDELTIKTLAESRIAREMECVVVMFKLYSSSWKKFTPDYFQWAVKEYCDSTNLPADAPDFVFFWNVVYDEVSPTGGFLQKLFKSTPKDRILKALTSYPSILELPELPAVGISDINKWFDRLTQDPLEKESQITHYFPGLQTDLAMSQVEKTLEQIIDAFNEQKLKNP
jgi:hypothetical protein